MPGIVAKMMLVLLIFSISCQKEDNVLTNEETSNQVQNILSRKLSFDELPHKVQVKKVLDNLNETFTASNNVIQRSIESDSVSILTDNVLYMTYDETHTYTFTLIRNNPDYYIENIVLHYNLNTNSYDEYLVQYNVTAENYIEVFDGGSLNENTNVLITDLDSGTLSTILGRSNCFRTCQTIDVPCQDPEGASHLPGEPCMWTGTSRGAFSYQSCGVTCIDITPSNDIDAGDSAGGGSGGGNPDGSVVVTNPNPTEPCQDSSGQVGITDSSGCTPVNETTQHQKNCEQLNILGSNQKIKESFQDLQSKAADAFITREFGYKLTLGEDPAPLQLGNDLTQPRPQYGGQIYGMSHTHQDKLPSGDKVFPMFSVEDVFNLGMLAIRHSVHPKEFDLYVFTLTVKTDNGGTETFALKINNWLDFVSWMNDYGILSSNDKERFGRILQDTYDDIYKEGGGNIPQNYLKPFFKFLQDKDIKGVDMYQANDPSLNSWKRLELKNGSIIEENC